MALELVRLKQGPMSSRWSFAGEKNGYRFYRSNTGKLFASFKDSVSGEVWYRVKQNT